MDVLQASLDSQCHGSQKQAAWKIPLVVYKINTYRYRLQEVPVLVLDHLLFAGDQPTLWSISSRLMTSADEPTSANDTNVIEAPIDVVHMNDEVDSETAPSSLTATTNGDPASRKSSPKLRYHLSNIISFYNV